MTTIGTKLAAVAVVLVTASTASAGKGGSAALIETAIRSGSVDAITAELERSESLMCGECVDLVAGLLDDDRYAVREVAAWWLAKRPALKTAFANQFTIELAIGDTLQVRNAADFLGRTRTYTALPTLREAIKRDLGADAKIAMVRAVGFMGHTGGVPVLVTATADGDATVRAAALRQWREIRGQTSAGPAASLLADTDARVRAEAVTVVGAMRDASALATLETLVVADPDPFVRRNAAWALGELRQASSRKALTAASTDASGLVRGVAAASLAMLR